MSTTTTMLLPEEILFEILARLPAKSLLRYACVCKSWNTLIRSPDFISAHLQIQVKKNNACAYLLIPTSTKNCFSICCSSGETFSKCLDITVPDAHDNFLFVNGSCNGLFCLSDACHNSIYLWNPSIRKIKTLVPFPIDPFTHRGITMALGFWFHSAENDYKVVRVMWFAHKRRGKRSSFEVEIYSLRLNAWRSISAIPPVSIFNVRLSLDICACLNEVVYWMAMERNSFCFILSFDFVSEEFKRIILPHQIVLPPQVFEETPPIIQVSEKSLFLFLQILRHDDEQLGCLYEVWVLEMDDTWKNTCTILIPKMGYIACPRPLGRFTTNGRFLMAMPLGYLRSEAKLLLYDPQSHQATDTGIEIVNSCQCINAYSESLILLN
ncbi:unnamed protein product [Prunus armeniaca]|uniref:F-box domain-containing protein n=1 Tax=Prunus armeniaca TaxID=36596 RepID=A0A6J5VV05_PRUAR|nr:unnamed protein product [Prunus armeniaca]